jgi:anti-anti-sigma factor
MHDVEVVRPAEDIAVIALHGDHDTVTKEQLARLLAEEIAANELVVVDVTDADFVDSSFLHNLVKADRLATTRGSRFVLQMGTARIVRSAIEVSGLLHSLEWVGSRDEALLRAPRRIIDGSSAPTTRVA